MSPQALKVGIAGLGTVGASVIRILDRQNEAVAQRGGRPVEVVAISARDRTKDRGFDLSRFTWFDSPVELARAFRAGGGRTGFLSNGVPEIVGHLRRTRALDAAFDAVVVSCEVGCMKPGPEIFRLCLERLGVAAGDALFADDRPENVEAARGLGLRAVHFAGDDALDRLRAAVVGG